MRSDLKQQRDITSFSSFSILIIFLMCCLVGLSLMPLLSVQLYPSRSYASIGISCHMPNASAQITETELTTPLESMLARLKGIKQISSRSGNGNAAIHIELDKWTDPELFRFEAAAMLRQLYPKLPKGASYPLIYLNRPDENGAFGGSIVGYTLNGPGTANDIAQVAEKVFKPAVSKLKGIYKFEILGAKPQKISIAEETAKMHAAGATHGSLSNTIGSGLATQDLGLVSTKEGRFNIAVANHITSFNDLKTYPVSMKNGRVFRLEDVAVINQESMQPSSYYRINGNDLVTLNLYPETHVNTIKLADDIKEVITSAKKNLPDGYHVALSYDNTEYIQDELNKIYFRTFLSIAILLVFVLLITRQVRYMVIIIASLIVNVLVSFIFYYFLQLEIHLYSLAGITISLGLIIDNVIVIVEDIRHTGRNRIFAAILASTLTALGALSVIFLLDEGQKINLLDFALAIGINLIISLPVAYFFIPAMLALFPVQVKESKLLLRRKRKLVWFNKFYHKQLRFMLRFRWCFLILFILLFGLPAFMMPEKINKDNFWAKTYNTVFGNEFYNQRLRTSINKYLGGALFLYINNQEQPSYLQNKNEREERTRLFINITMPNGALIEQINEISIEFEKYLTNFDAQLEVFTSSINSPNYATIDITFKKEYEHSFPYRLKQLLESKAMSSGAADFNVYGVGQGFSNALNMDEYDATIELKGYNFNDLQNLALRVRDTLSLNPRVQHVLITTANRWDQKPYREYIINFTRAEYLNLYRIGRWNMSGALQNFQENRATLGRINMDKDFYMPLELVSNSNNIPGLWTAVNLPIQVNDSTMLRLNGVSNIKQVRMGESIVKQDQTYLLNVHYQFLGSSELNGLVKERMIKVIGKLLPFGYSVSGGAGGWWGSAGGNSYLWFIPLVLLIIYMICAILLESFIQPIAIVLMIPFSFIGVFLIFYALGLQFDQGGYAALLMLAGLVTNAALYIINDVNFITKHRKWIREQKLRTYIKAFNAKAMPIMVTTASAILSLLPFMINGEEKGFWFTLSAGTIGGLLFSLLGAYILLPLCLLKKEKNMAIYKAGKIW